MINEYLPISHEAELWGIILLNYGKNTIKPGTRYPSSNPHPSKYWFSWEQGRVLEEYQLIFVSKGSGLFETRTGSYIIQAPNLLILTPGQWHRYRPDIETGWTETWVGFTGSSVARIIKNFFNQDPPIYSLNENITTLLFNKMSRVIEVGLQEDLKPFAASGALMDLLYELYSFLKSENNSLQKSMVEIEEFLIDNLDKTIDFPKLAQQSGMSYSSFRTKFKTETGYSPNQFFIKMKLNKAALMLSKTRESISNIAEQLGFSSLYYFSRLFKQKFSVTPSEYRKQFLL